MSLQQIAHIDEILDRIFVHLDTPTLVRRIQLVNKQWYRVADVHVDYNNNNNEREPAIVWAAQFNKYEIVQRLLQNPNVDPGANNNQAIRYASERGHVETVRLLLSHPKVDPSAYHNYAIQLACYLNRVEVVRLLLAHPKVDPSSLDYYYMLQQASLMSRSEIYDLLLQDERVKSTWVRKI